MFGATFTGIQVCACLKRGARAAAAAAAAAAAGAAVPLRCDCDSNTNVKCGLENLRGVKDIVRARRVTGDV